MKTGLWGWLGRFEGWEAPIVGETRTVKNSKLFGGDNLVGAPTTYLGFFVQGTE